MQLTSWDKLIKPRVTLDQTVDDFGILHHEEQEEAVTTLYAW